MANNKRGVALRAFKVATAKRAKTYKAGDEVSFPRNQFDDFEASGMVGPAPKKEKTQAMKPKSKRATKPETDLPKPGNRTASNDTTKGNDK